MTAEIILHDEVQLQDYGETRAGGAFIKLRLPDPEILARFRGMDTATAKNSGHIFYITLVEVAPEYDHYEKEKPTSEIKVKGGALANLAGRLCVDVNFQNWVADMADIEHADEELCRRYVLDMCEIESRSELDHDERAANLFHESIRRPYSESVNA